MKTKFLSTLAACLVAASLALSGTSYAAGTAAFSLSPASGTQNVGSVFSVGIYENGTGVNVVTANLSYDTNKLQLVSVDTSASAFSGDAGSSSTSISRYVPAGSTVSGTAEVAVLNFKAMAGSGSATVSVGTSGSHIASSGVEQWNGALVSGNYSLATPAATITPPTTTTGAPAQNPNTATSSSKTTGTNATNPAVASTSTDQASVAAKGDTNNSKTLGVANAKATVNDSHTVRNTVWTSLLVLLVVAAGVYWTYVRKQPVAVTSPVANKRKPAKKRTTASKAKAKK